MRTELVIAVPLVLLAGLLIGAWGLHEAAPSTSACTVGNCPLQISASQGNSFVYTTGNTISVYLNEQQNPQEHLSTVCDPDGALTPAQNPSSQPPYYSLSYTTAQVGTCTFKDDDFSATIIVQPKS